MEHPAYACSIVVTFTVYVLKINILLLVIYMWYDRS